MPPASFAKFWRERVIAVIVAQLMQGVTPPKMALTIALGFSLGVIPVLGITTALCAVAAIRLKLNQPVIQLVNWLVYPLQLAWLLIFVRIGERIMQAPPVSFSIPELLQKLHESPLKFLQVFGVAELHGAVAWLFIAPFLTAITFSVLLLPLKRLADIKASMVRPRPTE